MDAVIGQHRIDLVGHRLDESAAVHQVGNVEEPAADAVADAAPRDGDREAGLAGARAADQHDVALVGQGFGASQATHQGLVHRRAVKAKSSTSLASGSLAMVIW